MTMRDLVDAVDFVLWALELGDKGGLAVMSPWAVVVCELTGCGLES